MSRAVVDVGVALTVLVGLAAVLLKRSFAKEVFRWLYHAVSLIEQATRAGVSLHDG